MLDLLFDRYVDRLFRYLLLFLKDEEEAKDLVQEIFIKVFQSLAQFKSLGRFESWFFTIARRKLIDRSRKRRLKTFSFDSLGFSEPPAPDNTSELARANDLLHGLPARDREVLQLRFIENLSYEEISEITGMTPGSLRNLVYRALRRIQEDNSDELPETQRLAGK
jgi:RNA polymerase sigma-70 factor (ECF subfamily)